MMSISIRSFFRRQMGYLILAMTITANFIESLDLVEYLL